MKYGLTIFLKSKYIILNTAIAIVKSALFILSFFFFFQLVKSIISDDSIKSSIINAVLTVLMGVTTSLFNYLYIKYYKQHLQKCILLLSKNELAKITKQNPNEFSKKSADDYVYAVYEVPGLMSDYLFEPIYILLEDVIKFAVIFVLLFIFNWVVALVCLFSSIFLIMFFYWSLLKQTDYDEKNITLEHNNRQNLETFINNHSYFFMLNKKALWSKLLNIKINKNQKMQHQNSIKYNQIEIWNQVVIVVFSFLPIIIITFFTFYQLYGLNLELFISLTITIAIWMKTLVNIFRTVPAFKVAKFVVNDFNIIKTLNDASIQFEQFRNLTLKNPSIQYVNNGKPLDINLEIRDNQKVAIVGKSGIGKSTLTKMIMGYDKNFSGTILWNNKNIKNIENILIKQNITYVDSKNFLFPGTIYENITLWNSNINKQKVKEIMNILELNHLNLDDKIENLNLSQGEQQKIKLSRVFLDNKKILIIDEGYSNIQANLAIEIREKLMKKHHIYIEISHHLNDNELLKFNKVLELK